MISVSNKRSSRLRAADRLILGGPWISTLQRKRRDGNPRGPFRRACGPTREVTPFLCHSCSKANQKSTLPTAPPIALLTESLRLDSSYEATTPLRLDLVMRQHALFALFGSN